jgi:hypothetical protein
MNSPRLISGTIVTYLTQNSRVNPSVAVREPYTTLGGHRVLVFERVFELPDSTKFADFIKCQHAQIGTVAFRLSNRTLTVTLTPKGDNRVRIFSLIFAAFALLFFATR